MPAKSLREKRKRKRKKLKQLMVHQSALKCGKITEHRLNQNCLGRMCPALQPRSPAARPQQFAAEDIGGAGLACPCQIQRLDIVLNYVCINCILSHITGCAPCFLTAPLQVHLNVPSMLTAVMVPVSVILDTRGRTALKVSVPYWNIMP